MNAREKIFQKGYRACVQQERESEGAVKSLSKKPFDKSVSFTHRQACDYRKCFYRGQIIRKNAKHVCNKRQCSKCSQKYDPDSVHLCKRSRCTRCVQRYDNDTTHTCNMKRCDNYWKSYHEEETQECTKEKCKICRRRFKWTVFFEEHICDRRYCFKCHRFFPKEC